MNYTITLSDDIKISTLKRVQFDVANSFKEVEALKGSTYTIETDDVTFQNNEVDVTCDHGVQTRAGYWLAQEIAGVVANCEGLDFDDMDCSPTDAETMESE